MLPHKAPRIAELREGHARVPEVIHHFRDPSRAFDEVMRLNDGGVSYLANALADVCKPGMKLTQITNRLSDVKKRMSEALVPYFVSTEGEQRAAERTEVAEHVIADFEECVSRQTFGTFIRGLGIDRARLADEFYEARTRGTLFDANRETPAQSSSSDPPRRRNLLDLVKSNGKEAPAVSRPAVQAAVSPNRHSRTVSLARAALQLWSQTVHEICDDETFANAIGVPRKSLKEVANELIATARRQGLENSIKASIVAVSHIETSEQAAAKATIIAERSINRFVAFMGVTAPSHPTAFDADGITDQPVNFQQEFVVRWLRSFYDQVLANARSADGLIHDPEQNSRLGQILSSIGGS